MRPARKNTAGYTLIELLVVISLISVLAIPLLITYRISRATQALRTSTEEFSDHIRSAHIFSRDAKDKTNWGVIKLSDTAYAIVSGVPDNWEINFSYELESQVFFVDDFAIWFKVGTGEGDGDYTVRLENVNEKRSRIDILKTGVVEATQL